MKYDHLKANASKSKQQVYNKLYKAYSNFINNTATKEDTISCNKLSKIAGVDRSWVNKKYYSKIKQDIEIRNEFLTRKVARTTTNRAQNSNPDRLENEIKELRAINKILLQQNALYKIETSYFQQEAENKTLKIQKLQEHIASLMKQLNTRAQKPIELNEFRKKDR